MRAWFQAQATRGRAQAGRALAMFSGFLQWCGREPDYKKSVNKDAAKPSEHADLLPRSTFRRDSIQVSQLPAWFQAAAAEPNRIGASYLVGLVLTGARREELARLKHDQIDWQWNQTEIADKVEESRKIPIAPYLKRIILDLPRLDGNLPPAGSACAGGLSGRSYRRSRCSLPASAPPHRSPYGCTPADPNPLWRARSAPICTRRTMSSKFRLSKSLI